MPRLILPLVLLLLLPHAVVAQESSSKPGSAKEDEQVEARNQEIRRLVAFLNDKGFYALNDPKEKEAIAELRKMSEHAAPFVADMLAEGLKRRKDGWIQVYRPLFILQGMGEHAKAALPDIIKALDDQHSINVKAAAHVLASIGPAAKEALPHLQRVSMSPDQTESVKSATTKAIKLIDQETGSRMPSP